MEKIKLNETPVRTARNFNINNIEIDDDNFLSNIKKFDNTSIEVNSRKNIVSEKSLNDFKLTYGLNPELENQVKNNFNKNYFIEINSKMDNDVILDFNFDEKNYQLVENIEILARENTKSTVIIKYLSENANDMKFYHNGIIRLTAKENAEINVIVVNLLNNNSNNLLSIENSLEDFSNVKYTMVEFGGKNNIVNYYSNLTGKNSNNSLNTIYLGKLNQVIDLNYIGELRGEKSNINIEVQGALKDTAKKHFKGTIDFKKGCKKAIGNENENCMLLSNTAKSLALPMLLCSEEDVEGNHSTSSGKVGEKELFYIMSRGFDKKEAIKLLVRANFNKILSSIKNSEVKNLVSSEIDKRLD